MNSLKYVILSGILIFISSTELAAQQNNSAMEEGYKRQIQSLDKETKAEMDIEKSKSLVKQ